MINGIASQRLKSDASVPAKIIHQTWKTSTIPLMYQDAVNSWRFHHPDWQYYLWTDEDILIFVKEFFPDFLSLFQRYPEQIQRVDMVRYMLLYQYGGIYADLDIACNRNMLFLLNHEIVLPETGRYFDKLYCSNDLKRVATSL